MMTEDDAPPTDGSTRVGQAVAAFTAVSRGPGVLDADDAIAQISEPIPIYSIGAPQEDSLPDTLLERAHRVGWRYLVFHGATGNVADLKSHPGDRPELIRGDDLVEQIVASGKLAEKVVDDTSRFSIRLLDLSILGQAVLWLASKKGDQSDRFFSLSPTPEELDPVEFLGRMSHAEKLKAAAYANTSDEAGG
jgi:hypothetical protein